MSLFSCTPSQLADVQALVGDNGKAATICRQHDVAAQGPQAAVLRYLATAQQVPKENGSSINILFILTSAYLVFIMQAGFASKCILC
jgi:hypothetical protein